MILRRLTRASAAVVALAIAAVIVFGFVGCSSSKGGGSSWSVPAEHEAMFRAAQATAHAKLAAYLPKIGIKHVAYTKGVRYEQRTAEGKQGAWWYVESEGSRWSWLTYPHGLMLQAVGPAGQWNPEARENVEHEMGHLDLYASGVPTQRHHEILKAAGLDFAWRR